MQTELNKYKSKPLDFKSHLQHELLERCRRNPNYSLRSFAKSLNISPSALSAMINGKRTITSKMMLKLGSAIGLTPAQVTKLAKSNISGLGNDLAKHQIALDNFTIISNWYNYAILELIKIDSFNGDPAWIAKSLGITKTEVNIAIENLQTIGLLEIAPNGEWIDKSADGFATNIHGQTTTVAAKHLQKQILELSIKALMELPTQVRNHTSMTMAIDPDDLPEAIEKIAKFRRELCSYFEKNKKTKQVYNLHIGLYPITKVES
jgi:hypothetical protein